LELKRKVKELDEKEKISDISNIDNKDDLKEILFKMYTQMKNFNNIM
jgi:hypothetical protein